MPGTPQNWISDLTFNMRLARMPVLPSEQLGTSSDLIAAKYDGAWLVQTKSIMEILIERLPAEVKGPVIDLGCATGYSTYLLSRKFRASTIISTDVSQKMLDKAKERVDTPMIQYKKDDMRNLLFNKPSDHAGLLFSAWSLQYSQPQALLDTGYKCLKQDGIFAFIIDYADTLAPLLRIYHQCLMEFQDQLTFKMEPAYPKDKDTLNKWLKHSGLIASTIEDGYCNIMQPLEYEGSKMKWLLETGLLTGLDRVLPLAARSPAAARFDELFSKNTEPLRHHYAMVIAKKL